NSIGTSSSTIHKNIQKQIGNKSFAPSCQKQFSVGRSAMFPLVVHCLVASTHQQSSACWVKPVTARSKRTHSALLDQVKRNGTSSHLHGKWLNAGALSITNWSLNQRFC